MEKVLDLSRPYGRLSKAESTAAAAAGTRFESGVLRSDGATAFYLNRLSLCLHS